MSNSGTMRSERTLANWAAACAVLVFIVVAASAWLRIATTPCPPAGCEGFTLADAVRLAHRVAAMGVTVLALVLAALAWKTPVAWGRRSAAVAILVLVIVLAIVGRSSAGSAPPAVELANILGGLALLACTVGLAVAVSPRHAASFRAATGLTLALVAAQIVLATAAPDWPLARWLHNLLASTALCSAIAAAIAYRAERRGDTGLPERVLTGH